MNLDPHFVLYKKIKSKLIIDLNIEHESINHLEENTGENFCDLGLGKDFLDMKPNT